MTSAIVYGVLLGDASMNWPSRNQLLYRLGAAYPIVHLEAPRPGDDTAPSRRPRLEQLDDNRYVVRNACPVHRHKLAGRAWAASALLDGYTLRQLLVRAGLGDYLLWLTAPDLSLAFQVPARRLIYDCIDPNFLPRQHAQFDRRERRVAARAAVVFATAKSLYSKMRAISPETYLVPNGAPSHVDLAQPFTRPVDLRGRSGPVVGYLGTIDWRFDVGYVEGAARALPDATFAIVGRINAGEQERISRLRALPNVLLPGAVDEPTGDAYVRAFDVGIIPFTPGDVCDAINPVKMFMYLAHGLPVVSTGIAECVANSFVVAASSPEEFAVAVARVLHGSTDAQVADRRAYAAANTWERRAGEVRQILQSRHLL